MIAIRMAPDHAAASSIARRALDLASDPGVSLAEATDHLVRLAKGRSSLIERALADLGHRRGEGAERDHARTLLRHAISELAPNRGPARVGPSEVR